MTEKYSIFLFVPCSNGGRGRVLTPSSCFSLNFFAGLEQLKTPPMGHFNTLQCFFVMLTLKQKRNVKILRLLPHITEKTVLLINKPVKPIKYVQFYRTYKTPENKC